MALRWRRSTDVDLLKRSYWQHYFAGLDMSSAWRTTGYTNRSSLDSCCQANAHSVVLLGVTRIQSRPTWRGAVCDPSHWAPLHLISSTEAHHMPVGHRVIWEVAGCRAGQEMGSSQAAGHQHHRHGLAMQQMQQDLLITDWALHPSVYPSVTQSVVFDGALHVYVFVQLFFGAIA